MPMQLSDRDIDLISRVVATEVDHSLARTNPAEYDRQVAGVVDTILNRVESEQFPNTVEGVANQNRQFSAIAGPASLNPYGRVDLVPDKAVPQTTRDSVQQHIIERQSGAPSSVGGGLHYANPNFSSPNNLSWINQLDGPMFGTGNSFHVHGTAPGFRPTEADLFQPLPNDEILAMAGLSSYGPTGINSAANRADDTGRMPSSAELAQFFNLPAPPPLSAPAPLPLDMQLARSGLPAVNQIQPPTFNAAYDPKIGAMVPIPPTAHLGAAVLGAPYPRGMEQDRGLQNALAQQIAPPPAPSPFAPNPVASVPINPATGMPQGSYNDTGSMPSFGSLANFATGAPAVAPSTSVAQMYGGMLPSPPSAPSYQAGMEGRGMPSMPSVPAPSYQAGMMGRGMPAESPGVISASTTTYVRPDGSSSPAMTREPGATLPAGYRPSGIGTAADLEWAGARNAGVNLGPMVAGGVGIMPAINTPTAAPQTQQVANPAYAQYMAAAAKEAKAQELARAQEQVLNSPYAAMMGKAALTAQQVQKTAPLPQPKPLALPPKTITVTKSVPLPRSRPLPPPKPIYQQFMNAMAAPQAPALPPPPAGAVGTSAGYYFGKAPGGGYVSLGRVNPNLTPAQTYAAASNYDNVPTGMDWAVGVPGVVGPSPSVGGAF